MIASRPEAIDADGYSPDDLKRVALAVLCRAIDDVKEGGRCGAQALAFLEERGARWADGLGVDPDVWQSALAHLEEPPPPAEALPAALLQQPVVSRPGARCELCAAPLATWATCRHHWAKHHAREAQERIGYALTWLDQGGRAEQRHRLELLAEARGCSYGAVREWRAAVIRGRGKGTRPGRGASIASSVVPALENIAR